MRHLMCLLFFLGNPAESLAGLRLEECVTKVRVSDDAVSCRATYVADAKAEVDLLRKYSYGTVEKVECQIDVSFSKSEINSRINGVLRFDLGPFVAECQLQGMSKQSLRLELVPTLSVDSARRASVFTIKSLKVVGSHEYVAQYVRQYIEHDAVLKESVINFYNENVRPGKKVKQ